MHSPELEPSPAERNTRKTLIDRVALNCEGSWHEFHLTYRAFIASIARRSGVAEPDLPDLNQVIFLEVHRDLTKSDRPDFRTRSFGAWLGQKVKWRVLEYHRHRYRREQATDPTELPETKPQWPFERLWRSDWNRKVLEIAMHRVAERPRNLLIFQALAVHEIPVSEVCERFGISRSNADTIKKRVKDKLATVIREIEAGKI